MAGQAAEAARRLLGNAPGFFEQRPFAVAYNLKAAEAEQLWRGADVVIAGPLIFGKSQWISARQALVSTLAAHHQKAPEQPGLRRQA